MATRGRKAEHAEALELIGYGLAKFAGPKKGKNEIANSMAKNRNAFFQILVDAGIATSLSAVSNRQDKYDPFFGTKKGYASEKKVSIYGPRKERFDNVIGHLSMAQYIEFINSLIAIETGNEVDEKTLQLVNSAKAVVY